VPRLVKCGKLDTLAGRVDGMGRHRFHGMVDPSPLYREEISVRDKVRLSDS
jgi:hypothetical protein